MQCTSTAASAGVRTRQAGKEGRPSIAAVALDLKGVCCPAGMVVRLQHCHSVAVAGQQRRAAEACRT